jgi:hypothetical protein
MVLSAVPCKTGVCTRTKGRSVQIAVSAKASTLSGLAPGLARSAICTGNRTCVICPAVRTPGTTGAISATPRGATGSVQSRLQGANPARAASRYASASLIAATSSTRMFHSNQAKGRPDRQKPRWSWAIMGNPILARRRLPPSGTHAPLARARTCSICGQDTHAPPLREPAPRQFTRVHVPPSRQNPSTQPDTASESPVSSSLPL